MLGWGRISKNETITLSSDDLDIPGELSVVYRKESLITSLSVLELLPLYASFLSFPLIWILPVLFPIESVENLLIIPLAAFGLTIPISIGMETLLRNNPDAGKTYYIITDEEIIFFVYELRMIFGQKEPEITKINRENLLDVKQKENSTIFISENSTIEMPHIYENTFDEIYDELYDI